MTKQGVVDEPLQSLDNGDNTDEKESIWASILRDVKSSTKKAPATKSLIVLGDNESGRTTLVAKLQGNDDPKRGAGLEYHYIDVKDDDRDDTPKLGVWILDGDVACSAPLLKFAIKPETLENTVVILVASMTQPWSLLSTLKKWTTLIEEHIDRLQIDPTRLRQMRDQLQYDFQHYIEPNDSSAMLTSSTSSTTIKSSIGGGRVPSSVSSVSLASTTPLSPTNGDEQVILPLGDGVLTKSLGIPVIVVITKCDVMPVLEKENDYKDEYFDFMQHHIRKFCLEYGAALFYTSVKEKKNIDKLYKYIVHKCYGYPFTSSAGVVDRDAIFIPTGWDNPKKADILLENLHRLKSTDNYSDVFVKPIVRRPLQRDNEIIIAEDDQEFLGKLQLTLNRATSPGRADENPTPGSTRTSLGGGGGGSQTPSGSGKQIKSTNASPSDLNRPTNERALANFFNNLLTKKAGGAVTPTSAGTPTTQRQASQSPTTPSSKRLQQHPLTFEVTPPPGRSRTPTSHKTFPSSLNNDSPPKSLSPVIEQQSKVEATAISSASPNIVQTPVEDKQSVHLDHHEQTSDHTLQLENDLVSNLEQQNSESIISQQDSILNITNNSPSNDGSHRRLSNDFSLSQNITLEQEKEISRSRSSQSPVTEIAENTDQINNNLSPTNHSRPISPLQHDEVSNVEVQKTSSSKNPSRSSSPVVNDNSKEQQQQDNLKGSLNSSRRNSTTNVSIPSRPSSPALNEPQQQDQTLSPPVTDLQTLSHNDAANIHPENELSNEILRSEQLDRRASSSDIQQSEVQNEDSLTDQLPRQPSTSNVNTSDEERSEQISIPLPSTNNNRNHLPSPVETSNENPALHLAEQTNSSSNTENQTIIKSSPFDHPPHSPTNSQQNNSPYQDNDLQKSPNNETSLSSFHIAQTSQSTTLTESLTLESGDTNPESHENNTVSSTPQDQKTRSRSPSPIIKQEQERSRSPSPIIEQQPDRSRSPSPTNKQVRERSQSPSLTSEQKQKRSRSPSPTMQQEQQRSGSSSPTTKQEQERSRSPSPTVQQEQQRSRSPSPPTKHKKERSRSPSPIIEQQPDRSRSSSPTNKQEKERSRSPSLTVQEEQHRSRSSSPVNKQEQERSRSPSPTTKHKKERSRSPSPTNKQERERSQSPSLTSEQKQKRSRSPSPTIQQEQQRSGSSSPITKQEQERSRSPSSTVQQEEQRSRSPSPTTKHKKGPSRSPSPIIEQQPDRSRSSSPTNKQEKERSRSPSPTIQQEKQRSRSSSPITKQEQERSRSASPVNKQERERSRSQSPSIKQKQEFEQIQSESPITEQNLERSQTSSSDIHVEQQRSRSPSPIIKKDQKESQPASPTVEQREEISQSSLLTSEEKYEQIQPTSAVTEQNLVRSRSPSPDVDRKSERNQSKSTTIEQIQDRSRSPSPITGMKETQNQTSSTPLNENRERSRSPSLNIDQNQERNRSPSPDTTRKEAQSPSLVSSPADERKEQTSRSPIQKDQRKDSFSIKSPETKPDFTDNNDSLSANKINSSLSTNNHEEKQSNTLESPKLEGNKPPRLSTDFNYDSTHHVQENDDPSSMIELKQSPVSFTENHSSQTLKSPIHENVLPTTIENQGSITPIPLKHSEQENPSHSLIQRSSFDHHHESIPTSSIVRRTSITRSQSQSTVARPNTLPFTPNNHDLDGLYMSNDYNDEDEIPEDSEYHHNSAPSTVTVEYRRSSLLHDVNLEQQHTHIDPNDISRRLSMVEKSRTEDNDNNDGDSINSKGT